MEQDSERIKEIFSLALQKKSPAEREHYLAGACQGQPELRQQVEALLQAHEQAGAFLAKTVQLSPSDFGAERAGTMIGRYKLLELIGEGGFGTVWMAEQEEPVRRRVALKVIKPGMDTKQVLARFESERQALAMMDHPSIARVFDGGATDTGRPYFVMELVRGERITDYCDANKLPMRERLLLFIQVCQAVQHAHQKGIIHRDLKPSNVLVTEVDGAPVPKVIDFGVAKATAARLTELTLFTGLHQMIGTPAYMSPEQAGLGALDMDTRSDIYALGVLLYELLTGQTPITREHFEKAGMDEIFRLIREQDPPKPSTRLGALTHEELTAIAVRRQAEPVKLNRLFRGDLDWIVMKALEKDRRRRYDTANGLAMDIQRHLQNEPVTAFPPGQWYRFQKMVRRNKVTFTAVSAVAASLLIGLGLSIWFYVREKAARQEAQAAGRKVVQLAQETQATEQIAGDRSAQLHDALKLLNFNPTNLAQAETYFRQSLQMQQQLTGSNSSNKAVSRLDPAQGKAVALEKEPTGTKDPDLVNSLLNLGIILARSGKWADAAADMTQLIKEDPSEHRYWWFLMPLLIQSGNITDYRTQCKAMLDRFGKTTDAGVADRVAKSCLLLPSAVGPDDLNLVGDLAAKAITLGKGNQWFHWFQFEKGLADYRQGRYAAALEGMQLTQKEMAQASDAALDMCAAETSFVSAMAHYRLQQPHEAYAALAFGLAIVQTKLPKLDGGDLGGSWYDVLTTYILMREAKDMIGNIPAAEQKTTLLAVTNDETAPRGQILQYAADINARSGNWADAAAAVTQAIKEDPSDFQIWGYLMPLLIQSGNLADYRTQCKAMLDRFGKTTDAMVADRVAKSCLLLPSAVGPDDLTLVSDLAAKAITLGKGSPWFHWFQFAKGLADYRQGRYAAALEGMQLAQKELAQSRDARRETCAKRTPVSSRPCPATNLDSRMRRRRLWLVDLTSCSRNCRSWTAETWAALGMMF